MNHDRITQKLCWVPVLYDLGIKTVNITADEGMQCWNHVEREKGKLEVDPAFDQMIDDLRRCGLSIWMALDVKANPIYLGRKQDWIRSRYREINNSYYDLMGWAYAFPELREPYLRYVRFIAEHFKGRIEYYSVGSDWPGDPSVVDLIRETIQEIDPNVDIANGWGPGYPGSRVDAGGDLDELASFLNAAGPAIRRKRAEGFTGQIMTSYMTWSIYPPGPTKPGKPDWVAVKDEFGFTDYRYWCESEMQRAKYVAQAFVGAAGLDMLALYCNPYFTSAQVGQSLFRVPEPGAIIHPMQPDAGYYVLRTVNTILDGWKPEDFEIQIDAEAEFQRFVFGKGREERMVALWIPGSTGDGLREIRANVVIPEYQASEAYVIDLMNGTEQKLVIYIQRNHTSVPRLLIKDYPAILRFKRN